MKLQNWDTNSQWLTKRWLVVLRSTNTRPDMTKFAPPAKKRKRLKIYDVDWNQETPNDWDDVGKNQPRATPSLTDKDFEESRCFCLTSIDLFGIALFANVAFPFVI